MITIALYGQAAVYFLRMERHFLCICDLDKEQISVFDYISLYGVKSDGINRYVHYI